MSSLTSPVRLRAPRAAAAVERARLALVPAPVGGAPRAPFAVFVALILAVGVVGLLMFNTQMQQASFRATELSERAERLAAERQALDMELDRLRDPQRLAVAGRELGMVMPPVPAFLRLSDGRVLGTPTAATAADGMPIYDRPARVPSVLNPPATVIEVPAKPSQVAAKPTKKGQTRTTTGPASAAGSAGAGTNDPAAAAQGVPR